MNCLNSRDSQIRTPQFELVGIESCSGHHLKREKLRATIYTDVLTSVKITPTHPHCTAHTGPYIQSTVQVLQTQYSDRRSFFSFRYAFPTRRYWLPLSTPVVRLSHQASKHGYQGNIIRLSDIVSATWHILDLATPQGRLPRLVLWYAGSYDSRSILRQLLNVTRQVCVSPNTCE